MKKGDIMVLAARGRVGFWLAQYVRKHNEEEFYVKWLNRSRSKDRGHITYYIDKEDLEPQCIKVILCKLESKLDNDGNIQLTDDDCQLFKELKKKWNTAI